MTTNYLFFTGGMHYVLEGSKNGAKFLAPQVRTAYRLDGRGARNLDPYGDQQRALWMAFREAMDAVDFTKSEFAAVIDAAKLTFRGVTRLYHELYHGAPAAA